MSETNNECTKSYSGWIYAEMSSILPTSDYKHKAQSEQMSRAKAWHSVILVSCFNFSFSISISLVD